MNNNSKPTLIILCGKSASGKDTTCQKLQWMFDHKMPDKKTNKIISDTTRPKRVNELNHVDYNFLTKEVFQEKIAANQYVEYTVFRDWYYGTNIKSIIKSPYVINFGVFNPEGVINVLNKLNSYFNIVVIYLKTNWAIRLYRSIKREHRIRLEHFRRLFADYWAFKDKKFQYVLNQYADNVIVISSSYDLIDIYRQCREKMHMGNFE